jgi:hypothetical protein
MMELLLVLMFAVIGYAVFGWLGALGGLLGIFMLFCYWEDNS